MRHQVCHAHCPGGGGSGGLLTGLVVVLAVIAAIVGYLREHAHAIESAASTAVEVIAITVTVVLVGAIVTAVAVVAVRVRRSERAHVANSDSATRPIRVKSIRVHEVPQVIPGRVERPAIGATGRCIDAVTGEIREGVAR